MLAPRNVQNSSARHARVRRVFVRGIVIRYSERDDGIWMFVRRQRRRRVREATADAAQE